MERLRGTTSPEPDFATATESGHQIHLTSKASTLMDVQTSVVLRPWQIKAQVTLQKITKSNSYYKTTFASTSFHGYKSAELARIQLILIFIYVEANTP